MHDEDEELEVMHPEGGATDGPEIDVLAPQAKRSKEQRAADRKARREEEVAAIARHPFAHHSTGRAAAERQYGGHQPTHTVRSGMRTVRRGRR